VAGPNRRLISVGGSDHRADGVHHFGHTIGIAAGDSVVADPQHLQYLSVPQIADTKEDDAGHDAHRPGNVGNPRRRQRGRPTRSGDDLRPVNAPHRAPSAIMQVD
jgi:hypothetical protein